MILLKGYEQFWWTRTRYSGSHFILFSFFSPSIFVSKACLKGIRLCFFWAGLAVRCFYFHGIDTIHLLPELPFLSLNAKVTSLFWRLICEVTEKSMRRILKGSKQDFRLWIKGYWELYTIYRRCQEQEFQIDWRWCI